MTGSITAIILAAGKGTRMRSAKHKVLHEIAGRSLLGHVLASVDAVGARQSIVVVGAGREQVEASLAARKQTATALQAEQLGTGHAVQCARPSVADMTGTCVVLYGDVPFVRPETIAALCAQAQDISGVAVLGFDAADPGAYGRLVTDGPALSAIVEFKDTTSEQRAITICNSGIIAAPTQLLFDLLDAVGSDNAAGEYYLTDIAGIAASQGIAARVTMTDEAEVQGVNSRVDLAKAAASFQERMRTSMMDGGVTLEAPDTVFFSHDTAVEADVTIAPHVVFGPGVSIQSGAAIKAFTHLEGCSIAKGASVGPYARLRPGADVGEDVKIGNFVEIKKAQLERGAKVSHLSYIGDARIGAGANIGAGTITCNYDGYFKYKTDIGAGAFIGSNSALVAPVTIGDGAIVGAGSVMTNNVSAGALGLTRAPQTEKTGWAARFNKLMSSRKRNG